jgi:hypothetical protein
VPQGISAKSGYHGRQNIEDVVFLLSLLDKCRDHVVRVPQGISAKSGYHGMPDGRTHRVIDRIIT